VDSGTKLAAASPVPGRGAGTSLGQTVRMIVWINGTFGVGKTSVAQRLLETLDGAVLFDPEHLGFVLRLTVPADAQVDFQTLPVWRESVVQFIDSLDRHYVGPVIVPMSIWRADYHEELIGGLRSRGRDVQHVTLMASEEVLRDRIERSDDLTATEWRTKHVRPCLEALSADTFASHLWTDQIPVAQLADTLAQLTRDG
jgi:AAA domain